MVCFNISIFPLRDTRDFSLGLVVTVTGKSRHHFVRLLKFPLQFLELSKELLVLASEGGYKQTLIAATKKVCVWSNCKPMISL